MQERKRGFNEGCFLGFKSGITNNFFEKLIRACASSITKPSHGSIHENRLFFLFKDAKQYEAHDLFSASLTF